MCWFPGLFLVADFTGPGVASSGGDGKNPAPPPDQGSLSGLLHSAWVRRSPAAVLLRFAIRKGVNSKTPSSAHHCARISIAIAYELDSGRRQPGYLALGLRLFRLPTNQYIRMQLFCQLPVIFKFEVIPLRLRSNVAGKSARLLCPRIVANGGLLLRPRFHHVSDGRRIALIRLNGRGKQASRKEKHERAALISSP